MTMAVGLPKQVLNATHSQLRLWVFCWEKEMRTNQKVDIGIQRTVKKVLTFITIFFFMCTQSVYSLPQVDEVESGDVNIEYLDESTMQITASDQAIINYTSFDIGENESVIVMLPSSGAEILNRVGGSNVSNIFGSLSCNGIFILISPGGINIGPAGNLQAAGLILSTRDIANADFLNGDYIFKKLSTQEMDILIANQGAINITNGGFGVLIAGAIENQGTIVAPMGKIALATGDAVTLNISGGGLVSIAIDEKVASTIVDAEGNPITEQLKNTGNIEADGGTVLLRAEAVTDIFEKAINLEGVVKANRVDTTGGVIRIIADNTIQVASSVTAEGGDISVETQGAGDINVTEDGVLSADNLDITSASAIYSVGNLLATDTMNLIGAGDVRSLGVLRAGSLIERGAAFMLGGTCEVGTADMANLDNAVTYTTGDYSGHLYGDVDNILIGTAETPADIRLIGACTFKAGTDGTGAFIMNLGSSMYTKDGVEGGPFDLTIMATETSTLRSIINIGTLTFNIPVALDTPPSFEMNNPIAVGGLTIHHVTLNTNGNALTVTGTTTLGQATNGGILNIENSTFNANDIDVFDTGAINIYYDGGDATISLDEGATFNNSTGASTQATIAAGDNEHYTFTLIGEGSGANFTTRDMDYNGLHMTLTNMTYGAMMSLAEAGEQVTLGDGNCIFTGNLSIDSGGEFDKNGQDVKIRGDFSIDNSGSDGIYTNTGGGGLITFDGGTEQNFTDNRATQTSIGDIQISVNGVNDTTLELTSDITCGSITIDSGQELDIYNQGASDWQDVIISGDFTNSGTFDNTNDGAVAIGGAVWYNGSGTNLLTAGGASFDTLATHEDATGTLQIANETISVVTFGTIGGTLDLDTYDPTMNVTTLLVVGGEFKTSSDSTLTVSGNCIIGPYGPYSGSPVFTGSGGPVNVGGDFTVSAADGETSNVNLSSTYLTVGGNLDLSGGGFTYGTSTIELTGDGTINTISTGSGPGNPDLYNLICAASGKTTTMDSDINIVGTLTLGDGELTDGANNYQICFRGNGKDNNGNVLVLDNETILTPEKTTLDFYTICFLPLSGYMDGVNYQNIPSFDYSGVETLSFSQGAGSYETQYTLQLQGDIIANDIDIYASNGDGDTNIAELITNGHNITANSLDIGSGGTSQYGKLTAGSSTIDINGNVFIWISADGAGTKDNEINAETSTWTVSGNWNNNDTFTADTSTVTFDGSGESQISGDTTFNNFTCETAGKQLTFEAGSTQTIEGTLTLTGSAGSLITLASSSAGDVWNINPQGTVGEGTIDVSYVDVQDSNNQGNGGAPIDPPHSLGSPDDGDYNNTNWFSGPEPVDPPPPPPDPEDPIDDDETEEGEEESKDGEISEEEMFFLRYEDRNKWKRHYHAGKYKTTVIVTEGAVAVGPYDETSGPMFEQGVLLTDGQEISVEGTV